jgi:hypothetical protein
MTIPQTALERLENDIEQLSFSEQLTLIEWLARRIRAKATAVASPDLAEMANDPEVQRELAAINREFAATEQDGLGSV